MTSNIPLNVAEWAVQNLAISIPTVYSAHHLQQHGWDLLTKPQLCVIARALKRVTETSHEENASLSFRSSTVKANMVDAIRRCTSVEEMLSAIQKDLDKIQKNQKKDSNTRTSPTSNTTRRNGTSRTAQANNTQSQPTPVNFSNHSMMMSMFLQGHPHSAMMAPPYWQNPYYSSSAASSNPYTSAPSCGVLPSDSVATRSPASQRRSAGASSHPSSTSKPTKDTATCPNNKTATSTPTRSATKKRPTSSSGSAKKQKQKKQQRHDRNRNDDVTRMFMEENWGITFESMDGGGGRGFGSTTGNASEDFWSRMIGGHQMSQGGPSHSAWMASSATAAAQRPSATAGHSNGSSGTMTPMVTTTSPISEQALISQIRASGFPDIREIQNVLRAVKERRKEKEQQAPANNDNNNGHGASSSTEITTTTSDSPAPTMSLIEEVICELVTRREEAILARDMDEARRLSELEHQQEQERLEARRKEEKQQILLQANRQQLLHPPSEYPPQWFFPRSWLLRHEAILPLLDKIILLDLEQNPSQAACQAKKQLLDLLQHEKNSFKWFSNGIAKSFFTFEVAKRLRIIENQKDGDSDYDADEKKDGDGLTSWHDRIGKCLEKMCLELAEGNALLSHQNKDRVPLIYIAAQEEFPTLLKSDVNKNGYDDEDNDEIIVLDDDEIQKLLPRKSKSGATQGTRTAASKAIDLG